MKDLSHLRAGPGCSWFEVAIGSAKTNTAILRSIKHAVHERYKEFEESIENYQTEPRKSGISFSGDVLKDFYEHPPTELKTLLKARRRDHTLDACPYCGFPRAPETLDHFLPKEDWPEYSIFSDNLVPQCRGCAPIKGMKCFSKNEKQSFFLHPIYSPVLSTLRFKIDVTLTKGKLTFSPAFSIPESITDDDAKRIKFHLKSLQITQRIMDYCDEQYRHWIRIAQSKPCDINSIFESRLSERECDPYPNNWATAFYQGVLKNPDAVQELQRHVVSKPLKSGEAHRFI
ncbi:hypothetical protein ACKUFS_14430 [Pseudomonas cannabina]|uniref:HNH endonuclease n=3 Tax=Pseudomonas syringae group TaxID=136849 RepID=I0BVX5_PSECA|nr:MULTISPECIES: hypothetical protein [Pseudomonas syringae group]AFH66573.1 hypothetical protein [Pseudomonas cannabina]KPW21036.1 hypothetical protein ALO83_103532 [Pseudomonas cannabina pv. alisalensis]MBM0138997.1 hypothetical protein [Pseudomonas cannabina pv. alisalensis]QHE96297.1 hypothetical protein PMA4326_006490 [Pseudomonas syringae pv. maculicola str. ES4326]QQN20644.1 hypothetical protein JGS08_18790 [Pseudomonas cannabina pv. alisalensis]